MARLWGVWIHVRRVAKKAALVAASAGEEDSSMLLAAAWLHDIGYSPEVMETGLHALDGGRWLRRRGFHDRVASLVAFHSCAIYEAEERGWRICCAQSSSTRHRPSGTPCGTPT
ncbi:HD domain-containing protein [Micromonospora chersina]|uniref:HD domain-containing protein n=1 Tax=Micromonospora chersina TaxID=47854 RepID=UPI00371B41D9